MQIIDWHLAPPATGGGSGTRESRNIQAILDFWNTLTPDNYDDRVDAFVAGSRVPARNDASGGLFDVALGSQVICGPSPLNE